MRLKLWLGKRNEPLSVPVHYNYSLQSLIYRHLDAHLAQNITHVPPSRRFISVSLAMNDAISAEIGGKS